MAAVNKKLKFVFFNKLMLYHYYFFKFLQPLKIISIQELEIYIWTFKFL